jgi:hypothetical protein
LRYETNEIQRANCTQRWELLRGTGCRHSGRKGHRLWALLLTT